MRKRIFTTKKKKKKTLLPVDKKKRHINKLVFHISLVSLNRKRL